MAQKCKQCIEEVMDFLIMESEERLMMMNEDKLEGNGSSNDKVILCRINVFKKKLVLLRKEEKNELRTLLVGESLLLS
jgi:hypothetical protein